MVESIQEVSMKKRLITAQHDRIAFRIACIVCPAILTFIWWFLLHGETGGFALVFLGPLLIMADIGCILAFIQSFGKEWYDEPSD
jgi:hypothetical protein